MELVRLVDAFEDGSLTAANFPHEAHVRVTWALQQRYEQEEAFRRLVAGIRRIAVGAGRPDAYHETITRAWFRLIAQARDLAAHAELFDKRLLSSYYSPEALEAGRERWVEPDLAPLRLPQPSGA